MIFQSVNIVGTGNLANHLALGLYRKGYPIAGIAGRSISKAKALAKMVDADACRIEEVITENILQIICVSDDAVEEVGASLPKTCMTVHTAGALSMDILPQEHRGVFYPLQSFSASREPEWKRIPLLLEANSPKLLSDLTKLAGLLSDRVEEMNAKERRMIHVAAVVVNNFVNHLYRLSADFMQEHRLDPTLMKPLMLETTLKAMELGAEEAQTGPAKRGDIQTINSHLEYLSSFPELAGVYKSLTQQILDVYHED